MLIPKQLTTSYNIMWEKHIKQSGVGSPRVTNINNDGVLDIIIGSGFEWAEKGDSALNAISGKDGDLLWRTEFPESVYGTPILIDINEDGINDVSASGRFKDFFMVSGKDGAILWSLSDKNPIINFLPCNFNSPTLLDDLDNDGVRDLLTIQGGLANGTMELQIFNNKTGEDIINAYDKDSLMDGFKELLKSTEDEYIELKVCFQENCKINTFHRSLFVNYSFDQIFNSLFHDQEGPGSIIYIISSKSGQIIKTINVPFGRESWSVPIYTKFGEKRVIIYGSGGERIGGFLIAQDIDTEEIIWSIESTQKGFISSPLLFYENDQPFVVANSMEGRVFKIVAETGDIVWESSVGGEYETYSSVAIGKFKGKDYYDVVSTFSRGVWPKYESASLFVFDGKSGEITLKEKVGYCQSASSPIISDIDNDLKDDILFLTCVDRHARFLVLNNNFKTIVSHPMNSGGFSTSLVVDLDNNNMLDLIVPRFHYMSRFELIDPIIQLNDSWSQYRGRLLNGVYMK